MLNKPTLPTKTALRAAAFSIAFHTSPILSFPSPALPYLPAWDTHASDALNAIVDFRAAIRRWVAANKLNDAELAAQYSRLRAAGLGGWIPALPSLQGWDVHATAAIKALVNWRSACRRWAAAGQVTEQELAAEYERLEAVGLAGWLDGLLGVR